MIYLGLWEYFETFLEASVTPELSIKEQYRFSPNLGFYYADKMMWPRPLAPKIKGDTVVLGDLIE